MSMISSMQDDTIPDQTKPDQTKLNLSKYTYDDENYNHELSTPIAIQLDPDGMVYAELAQLIADRNIPEHIAIADAINTTRKCTIQLWKALDLLYIQNQKKPTRSQH